MKKALYSILFICVFSCEKAVTVQDLEPQQQEEATLKISKKEVANLKFAQFLLDTKAKNTKEFWQKYTELNNIVAQVNQADLSFFKENNEILLAFIKELKETLPENLDSPLIQARLVALETMMLKLEGVVNLSNPEKTEVLLVLRDFLISFSNLNLQINKKLERESQNIQKPN